MARIKGFRQINESFTFADIFMKRIIIALLACVLTASSLFAQESLPSIDKSPVDICYYPINFPVLKIQNKVSEPLMARIIYSRPKKESRPIFGGLVEYGKLWRLGANEATELEFYKNVTINGKNIPKGRYTLYAIVNETNWVFVINKETDTWGSFKYDASKDVVRVEVPVQKLTTPLESLAMSFEKNSSGINLVVAWENVKVAMPINP
jgi:hypothetical protein